MSQILFSRLIVNNISPKGVFGFTTIFDSGNLQSCSIVIFLLSRPSNEVSDDRGTFVKFWAALKLRVRGLQVLCLLRIQFAVLLLKLYSSSLYNKYIKDRLKSGSSALIDRWKDNNAVNCSFIAQNQQSRDFVIIDNRESIQAWAMVSSILLFERWNIVMITPEMITSDCPCQKDKCIPLILTLTCFIYSYICI